MRNNLATRTNSFIYDANGDLRVEIGPDRAVQSSYDYTNHQVWHWTNAPNEVTTYDYSSNRQLTDTTQPNGLKMASLYDSSNRLSQTFSYAVSNGVTLYYGTNRYTYQSNSVLVHTHTDPRGLTQTNTWDKLQRLRRVDFPAGGYITNTFENLDLVRVVDRLGYTNRFVYNSLRQLTQQIDASTNTNSFNYCACGTLEYVVNALNQTKHYVFDNQGNRT